MHLMSLAHRTSTLSKLVKFNVLCLVLLVFATTMVVSFASPEENVPAEVSAAASSACGSRVALVLDRSGSISVDENAGGHDAAVSNVEAIRNASAAFVDAIKGPDSYMDLYAFGSVAQRINTVPSWYRLNSEANVNLQKYVIATTKFKTGVNLDAEDAYVDELDARDEAYTNWEHALKFVQENRTDPQPNAIVIFTDGNPTTDIAHTELAIAAGGSYEKAGFPNEASATNEPHHSEVLAEALAAGDSIRNSGIRIIPVSVGNNINRENLQSLAGKDSAGNNNPVYSAANYSELTTMFERAAANVCQNNAIFYSGIERTAQGDIPIALPVQTSLGSLGTFALTTTGKADPKWAIHTFAAHSKWDFRAIAEVPAGYRAVEDYCRRNAWDNENRPNNKPGIDQVEGTAQLNNEVLIRGNDPGGWTICEFVVEKIPAVQTDGIRLDKSVSPTTANKGDTVTYSFLVTNTGESTLSNVTITDAMLNGQVGDTIATLAPGASAPVFTKTYVIPQDATSPVHNIASVVGTPVVPQGSTARPDVTWQDPADVILASAPPDGIKIEKTVNPTTANPGDTVTYSFVVTNTGTSTLTNVKITDTMLGGQMGATIATLAPGASTPVFTKTYVVPDGTGETIHNIATVVGTPAPDTGALPRPDVTDDDPADLKVVEVPSIAITKSADKTTANVGDTITYEFVVTNTSQSVTLTDITVVDNILGDLGDIESLEPGEAVTKSIKFIVPLSAANVGNIHNIATACFTVPVYVSNCASDDHTVTVTQVAGKVEQRTAVSSLPLTGSQSLWLGTVALLTMGLGSTLIMITRKRKGVA